MEAEQRSRNDGQMATGFWLTVKNGSLPCWMQRLKKDWKGSDHHMDLHFPETPDFPANAFQFDLDEYFGQLNRLKEQYKGKLDLRIGVEIGLQKHLGEAYHRLTEHIPLIS